MNRIEKIIYSLTFLINKYTGSYRYTENILNWYENKMIKKYIPLNEIEPFSIPLIEANELTNDKFLELSNNYKNPVLIKGYMRDTNAALKWDINYLQNIIGDFNINILNKTDKLSIQNYKFNDFVKDTFI